MFSLAGVPPMLGFFAKFGVLKAAVDANMTWLALAGAVASVIGAFYYLRIVFYMYFGSERDGVRNPHGPVQWVLLIGGGGGYAGGCRESFRDRGCGGAGRRGSCPLIPLPGPTAMPGMCWRKWTARIPKRRALPRA
jgi:hypothetical protein